MNEKQAAILEQWFGAEDNDEARLKHQGLWWKKDPQFDQLLKDRFGALLKSASQGELDDWRQTPKGRLALIILLDQFSRNIFRDTKEAFAQDTLAYELCIEGIERRHDRELSQIERTFFYMPMMHQEDKDCQKRSVQIFKAMLEEAPEALKKTVQGNYDAALGHARIIERFGRYPHRNTILERESTAEEIEFLKQPNSSY